MPGSTVQVQTTLGFVSTHADLVPLVNVGGYNQQPTLDIINDVFSDLLTSPNDWKFNQIDLPMLVTALNKQDYLFAGAAAFTTQYGGLANGSASTGAAVAIADGVTVTDGVVTVQTLEPHRFSIGDTVFVNDVVMTTGEASAYNSTYSDNGTSSGWTNGWVITAVNPTSFSFAATAGQNNGDAGGAPGINNYGWLASATMMELNNTSSPQNSVDLEAVKTLQPWSKVSNPEKVCVYQDLGNGVLKIRCWYVPGSTIWGIKLVLQAAAPVFTTIPTTWAPFPDNLNAIYRQALLYRMYRYINSSRADTEYQKLQQEIAKFRGFDDAEDSDVHMVPAQGSLGNSTLWYWGG